MRTMTMFKYLLLLNLNFVLQFHITATNLMICDVKDDDVKLLLFTRDNQDKPILLNSKLPENVPPKTKTVIITHGYNSNHTKNCFPDLKNQYLTRYDCNVIMVDWSKFSMENYLRVVCRLPHISLIVAKFLCELTKQNNTMDSVHMVGHSLGAQISGQAGFYTVDLCDRKIGRITGLDPAGPLYYNTNKRFRLDKSDASFVDVIHTNALFAGYIENCGHVDFYVNCGSIQETCLEANATRAPTILGTISCSHLKSISYFRESMQSDQFIARSCSNCPLKCAEDKNPEYIIMGEDCPRNSTRHVFSIPTNENPPYAEGWKPYENEDIQT